jgi:acyl carrier protein
MMNDIKEVVFKHMGEGGGVAADSDDLTVLPGFSSLVQIAIAADLEDRFAISFSPDEIENLNRISVITELVSRKVAG